MASLKTSQLWWREQRQGKEKTKGNEGERKKRETEEREGQVERGYLHIANSIRLRFREALDSRPTILGWGVRLQTLKH